LNTGHGYGTGFGTQNAAVMLLAVILQRQIIQNYIMVLLGQKLMKEILLDEI
jgi:hypothetical protein